MTELRTINLRLPWPPSTNKIWRAVGGRVLLSEAAREYAVRVQNALPPGRVDPLRGRLFVIMQLFPPSRLARKDHDIANREKCLFDCLTKQRVWLDDSQIDSLHIHRGSPDGEGYVLMHVEEIDIRPNEN